MNESIDERRKFKRVSPPPEEFFVYCHETKRMSVVMNISIGGFKIECYISAQSIPDSITVNFYAPAVDRFHQFRIAGIPCRVVYDIANLSEGGTFSGTQSRICGFKFRKLTAAQKDNLKYLLGSMNQNPGRQA